MSAAAAAQSAPSTPVPTAPSSATCTNAGNTYHVGDYACIAACHGERRMARCDQVGQAGSWTYVSNACPSAMITSPWPSTWSEVPAVSDMTPIPVAVHMSAIDPDIARRIGSHYGESNLTR